MNLREWLVVLGGVVIVGIVIDGIRRMRRARRDSMEISLGMGGEIQNTPLDEGFNPELPNGGARPVGSESSDFNRADETVESCGFNTDSLRSETTDTRIDINIRKEPSIDTGAVGNNDFDDDNLSSVRVVARNPNGSTGSGVNGDESRANDKISVDSSEIRAAKTVSSTGRLNSQEDKLKSKMTFGEGLKASASKAKLSKAKPKPSKTEKVPQPAQEVIVLNVMSRSEKGFSGTELNTLLKACGVEHGDMSIYHRRENTADSPIQFSVANAVEPGYFPKDQLETMSTPGICFFMSLPGPDDNMRAFDYMVETAQCVVRNLSGEMKDERRSDMTPQTLEHCRERIRDFERRQLTARC
ncbi:cell division protein ZipA [Alkalimarinus alittae]|uniref:Cell division protein ZipA n=1 Tax=Alkalimarinus alittae TaxID=2961619 RepID=A0ABY6N6K4_9ALTE|nr:cell division protein ZipA [Alkalimarinus alittae]UZE97753.1 cell division protein ZipA [Alkalimarinus alittae]